MLENEYSVKPWGIDPLRIEGYIQKCFPHLFPYGELRMENISRNFPISECDMIKHMVNLKDKRFCNDPVFPYVLMDLKNRYQSRKFARFFF